jgi:hypothetical protein
VLPSQVPGTPPPTQSYFKIAANDEDLRPKVTDHFHNHLQVDANDVIEKLLELKREEKGKGRGMRPARAAN